MTPSTPSPAIKEREAIVAWLRMVGEGIIIAMTAIPWAPPKLAELQAAADAYALAADAIEAATHLQENET